MEKTKNRKKKRTGKGKKPKAQKRKTWEKAKKKKGKKTKARSEERHGPAYYFICFNAIKEFASRIKKASNLVKQAKRIESFRKITNNKLAKVGNK